MRPTPLDKHPKCLDNANHEHWIFGPGAVGAMFIANLSKKNMGKTVLFGNQSSSCKAFEVMRANEKIQFNSPVIGKLTDSTPQFSDEPVSEVTCYFTVHTPALTKAIETSFEFLNVKRPGSVNFIICSNGILTSELISKMSSFSVCPFSCYRALLYFGASRMQKNNQQIVRHIGGNRIVYGQICAAAQAQQNDFQPNEVLDWFSWQKTENIQSIEREKFLMNVLLAFSIGPRLLSNENVFAIVSPNEYELWLQNYIALVRPILLNLAEFDSRFRQLVSDTAKNINSYSLKWHAGDSEIIDALLADFQYQINISNAPLAASFLKEKINTQLKTFGWPQNARWLA